MPAARPVAPTMKAEPTPMKAIWATTRSMRNGGRTAQAAASTANRIMRPKSSSAALNRSSIARAFSHGGGRSAAFAPGSPPRGMRADRRAAILRPPMVNVGGEVDALCSRCELVLAHTVHAVVSGQPVKVECNTCHVVHRYRAPAGRPAGRVPGAPRTARAPKAPAIGFDELLAARDQQAAQP